MQREAGGSTSPQNTVMKREAGPVVLLPPSSQWFEEIQFGQTTPNYSHYSVLPREEAHYSHATQSYRGRRPTIHTLLSPTEGGGPLFIRYSVLLWERAHYATHSYCGMETATYTQLNPTVGGSLLLTHNSLLPQEGAHYQHNTQSYRRREPTTPTQLIHTARGSPLLREEAHYSHTTRYY